MKIKAEIKIFAKDFDLVNFWPRNNFDNCEWIWELWSFGEKKTFSLTIPDSESSE